MGLSTPVKCKKEHSFIRKKKKLLNSYQWPVSSTSYCHPDSIPPVSTAGVINENTPHRYTYIRKLKKVLIYYIYSKLLVEFNLKQLKYDM